MTKCLKTARSCRRLGQKNATARVEPAPKALSSWLRLLGFRPQEQPLFEAGSRAAPRRAVSHRCDMMRFVSSSSVSKGGRTCESARPSRFRRRSEDALLRCQRREQARTLLVGLHDQVLSILARRFTPRGSAHRPRCAIAPISSLSAL